MKSLNALLLSFLCIVLTYVCTACGEVNESAGVYICSDSPAKLNGLTQDDEWIELRSNGTAAMHLMSRDFDLRWSADGDKLTLTMGGEKYEGFVEDGVITVSLDGMIYTYVREGASLPAEETAEELPVKQNALQKYWNGGWYGWWRIHDGAGEWSELDGSWYDCCASVELDAVGTGKMNIWDDGGELCRVGVKLVTENAASRVGALSTADGFFWSWRIGEDDWFSDPGAYEYENCIYVENGYYEDDNGSFRYDILLRPWGQSWDDIAGVDVNSLPEGYYDWYLPLTESGESMPDKLD